MRNRGTLIKSRLISFILALGLLLSLTLTGMAASSSNVQDGLEVSISTDKDNYADSDSIKVSLTVKNTNSFSVEDVKLENLIPEGYELAQTSAANKSVGLLKPGETVTLDTLLTKPVNNANPSNNNSSNNSNISNSVLNSNTQTTTKKNTASNYSTSNNKTTSTTNKAKVVYTGDNSQLLLWVGIALSSLFAIALALWLKKKKDGSGKALLSLFLAGSLLASTLALSSFSVKAEDSADSNVGVIKISTNASVNSKDLSLDGKVTYNKEHLKNESINRYQWIKMLIEKREYDYDIIADQPQIFEDVSSDNEYYPYVQMAALWDIIDKGGRFDGEQLATESFVGITGVKSIGITSLNSIIQDSNGYSNKDLFAVALQNNIAMGPENSVVLEATCADRLNNIIDFMFSNAANQDYENIVFKDSVIQLPDNYPYSEDESGLMTITNVDDKKIVIGDIVSFHTDDGTFLAGKVISVTDDKGKSVLQMEEVSPEEIFDRYEALLSTPMTPEMVWDYYETISIAGDDSGNIDIYDLEQTAFDFSKELRVETLLNQEQELLMPTPMSNDTTNLEVKFEYKKTKANNNVGKGKLTVTVKDLNSGVSRSFNLSAKNYISLKNGYDKEEEEEDSISFTFKMKNLMLTRSASLINKNKNPTAKYELSGDIELSVEGSATGTFNLPIPGCSITKDHWDEFDKDLFEQTATFNAGLFFKATVEGSVNFTCSIPSIKISSEVSARSGLNSYNSTRDNPVRFTLDVSINGEIGFELKAELAILKNRGIELKANLFFGAGIIANAQFHDTYCTCVDVRGYPCAHGKASAKINFWTKAHYNKEFLKLDESNCPQKYVLNAHFENYYDAPSKSYTKVPVCTYDSSLEEDVFTFNGHVYALSKSGLNWIDAKEYCESLGGHLVTITSPEENDFVSNISSNYVMIGLTDETSEGAFSWVTGEKVNYLNWAKGEPNNMNGENYVLMEEQGVWNDGHLEEEIWYFVCEWDSEEDYINYRDSLRSKIFS